MFSVLYASRRYFISIKAFFVVFVMYLQRNGLSNEILCMSCPDNITTVTHKQTDCLSWNKSQRAVIIGSFFWGYAATQIIGGWFVQRLGAKRSIIAATVVSSVFTFILPFTSVASYALTIVVRIVTGISQGLLWPFIQTYASSWSPEKERSIHLSITTCGLGAGPVVALVLSGVFCRLNLKYSKHLFFRTGWSVYFYFSGLLGLLDALLTFVFFTNYPKQNKFISADEKKYIERNKVVEESTKSSIPWKEMALLKDTWVFLISLVLSDVGIYAVWTIIPEYMERYLNFNIVESGVLAAIPYIFHVAAIILSGTLSKFIISSKKLEITGTRKLFHLTGCIGAAVCVISIAFIPAKSRYVTVALLIIGFAFHGLIIGGGVILNCNDFAGEFSGIVFSIGNTASSVVGFIVPVVTAKITDQNSAKNWRIVFFLFAACYLMSAAVFFFFGSSEKHNWKTFSTRMELKEDYKPAKEDVAEY